MMAYDIYWVTGSAYSWRVLFTLELKRIDYQSKLLQASKAEHKSPEYLKINPRGRIPSLTDGDYTIYESMAIMAYLDLKHPQVPLFGTDVQQSGSIWQRVFEIENYVMPAVLQVTRPIFFNTLDQIQSQLPEMIQNIEEEFANLDQVLAENDYICGDVISAADVAFLPALQALYRAYALADDVSIFGELFPLDTKYPHLISWNRRMEALPAFEKSYPPNWKT